MLETKEKSSPKEVFLAVKFPVARETLVRHATLTVVALDAGGVPRLVKNVEQELLHDRQPTPSARHHHGRSDGTLTIVSVYLICTNIAVNKLNS